MGCCVSLVSRDSDNSPYTPGGTQEHHADSSSRAINSAPALSTACEPAETQSLPNSISQSQSQPNLPPSRNPRSTVRRRSNVPTNVPLSEHYNQPIRPHVWRSKRRIWSRGQLSREREEFFDTRVSGRPEVWAALSAATTLLREGDTVTAQSIIDAAGVTVPTGDLCEGCYDENGALYRLPEAIVGDPTNVVDTSSDDSGGRFGSSTDLVDDEAPQDKLGVDLDSEDEYDEELERRREEKGKGIERDFIRVTARLSDRGGPDIIIGIGKEQSVSVLARKVQVEAGIRGKQRVRIAYLGKILKDNESLLAQGWVEGHVVNALVVLVP